MQTFVPFQQLKELCCGLSIRNLTLPPCCTGFTRKLLAPHGRQKGNNVAPYIKMAGLDGVNYQVVLELASAERLIIQMEDDHLVLGPSQRDLFRSHVLDDQQDRPTFFLVGLSLLF